MSDLATDVAHDLAQHATDQEFGNLAESTIRATTEVLFDSLAVSLGGLHAPGIAQTRKRFASWGGGPSSVWGGFPKAAPPVAALLNAGALHALDYDDTDDLVPLHASSVVLPALIADLEENRPDCSGREFLTAFAVGLDGAMRVGRAGGPKGSGGWNYSVISGGIGAVLAVARLRQWGVETTVNALGHQLAQTAGSLQSIIDGTLAKRFQPAVVAKNVLFGAALADAGIDGPRHVFEGRAGFFALYQDSLFDREALLAGVDVASLVDDLSIKPYPACRFTHAAIDLAIRMREEGVTPEQIEGVTFLASGQAMNMVGRDFDYRSANIVDAQFSMAYTAGVALHRGSVVIDDFDMSSIRNAEVGEFVRDRVRIQPTDDVEFLAMAPITARVELRDGRAMEFVTKTVSGSPQDRLSVDQLKAKATDCLRHGGANVTADELWDAVQALGDDSRAQELIALLNRPGRQG